MTKKPQRVPGMTTVKPNREQRRHPDGVHPQDRPLARDTDAPDTKSPTLNVADPRAKSTGHGKKTADKWNQ
jgi:hypothetical protein